MRGWWVLTVLALAGCGENQGWNPNYQFGNDPYGRYRAAREAALVTDSDPLQTVPVARPVYSPTAAQIAGRDPVPIPRSMGLRIRRPVAIPAPGLAPPSATIPVGAPAPATAARVDRRPTPGAPIPITPPDMTP